MRKLECETVFEAAKSMLAHGKREVKESLTAVGRIP